MYVQRISRTNNFRNVSLRSLLQGDYLTPRYIPEDILISDLRKIAHRFDEYFDQKAAYGKRMYLSKKEVAHLFENFQNGSDNL